MRIFTGVMGVLVVPTGYLTIKAAGHSTASAVVAAFLLAFGMFLFIYSVYAFIRQNAVIPFSSMVVDDKITNIRSHQRLKLKITIKWSNNSVK